MSKESKIAQRFLEGIGQKESKVTFETLTYLINELENKADPEPEEIKIVESLYNFVEKFKILEYNLRQYVKSDIKDLPGNKLSSLYENGNSFGTSKLFD
jgi:hypothetical protein